MRSTVDPYKQLITDLLIEHEQKHKQQQLQNIREVARRRVGGSMKPYYVLSLVGEVDANGAPKQFGLLAAEDPAEAEDLVMQVAKQHACKNEICSLAILQLYRSYPSTLLRDLAEKDAEILRLKSAHEDALRSNRALNNDLNARNQTERDKALKAAKRKRKNKSAKKKR